jgi:hypothetical protein
MNPVKKPLWFVLRPTDRDVDFGAMSAKFMAVSRWLEQYHQDIEVADTAPVNYSAVYAVLAYYATELDVPTDVPLRQVTERIGRYIGVPVPV